MSVLAAALVACPSLASAAAGRASAHLGRAAAARASREPVAVGTGGAVASMDLKASKAGIDHVCCGDHVSFADAGFDGLVQATALAMLLSTAACTSCHCTIPSWWPASSRT